MLDYFMGRVNSGEIYPALELDESVLWKFFLGLRVLPFFFFGSFWNRH